MSRPEITDADRFLIQEQVLPLVFITEEDLKEIFVFHKPGLSSHSSRGYVSSFSALSPAREGFTLRHFFKKTGLDQFYPPDEMVCFGRLDRDTSGLLVIAKKGRYPKFMDQLLLNPYFSQEGFKVSKVYQACVKGVVDGERLKALRSVPIPVQNEKVIEVRIECAHLISVENEKTRNAGSCAEVEILEGKHHQVKKIFYALGHPVRQGGLHRVRFGRLTLAAYPEKEFSEMRPGEVRALFDAEKKWLVETYNGWLRYARQYVGILER